MKYLTLFLSFSILLSSCSAQLGNILSDLGSATELSNAEVASGLKEALSIGTMVKKINHAAEDAAIKAKPIFLNAIKQLTFADVWNILTGADNAATSFLQRTTTQALFNEFHPVITNALNQQGALDLWSSAVTKYNAIPLVKKANPDVASHVTNKALEGLFKKIADEELDIRHNFAARTTDLLKKVFAKQDKK